MGRNTESECKKYASLLQYIFMKERGEQTNKKHTLNYHQCRGLNHDYVVWLLSFIPGPFNDYMLEGDFLKSLLEQKISHKVVHSPLQIPFRFLLYILVRTQQLEIQCPQPRTHILKRNIIKLKQIHVENRRHFCSVSLELL